MSAEKKKHDFHLVDPSPWPIYVSFATLVLAVGAVYYFHSKALWLLLIGFALVVYGAFMWWRDVIEEAEHQGHHTPVVQIGHRYGMTLFIASEVMFFVAWFDRNCIFRIYIFMLSSLRISSCHFHFRWKYLWFHILYGYRLSWLSCDRWNNLLSSVPI
jgi:hypothetical protein